jgi:hypothetical protein
MLSNEQMRAAGVIEVVEIPDCGDWGTVRVRKQVDLTGLLMIEQMKWPPTQDDQATLIIHSVVDESDALRFTEADRPWLRNLKSSIVVPLILGIRAKNDVAEKVEEAEKNSEPSLVA